MKSKQVVLAAVAGLVALLGLASAVWACTAVPSISLSPEGGGGPVTVNGNGFERGVPVHIRWNSADGPLVATGNGPDFSVQMSPPEGVAPGVYYVIALQVNPAGTTAGKAAAVYEVGGAVPGGAGVDQKSVLGDLWPAFSPAVGAGGEADAVSQSGRFDLAVALGAGLVSVGVSVLGLGTLVALRRNTRRPAE